MCILNDDQMSFFIAKQMIVGLLACIRTALFVHGAFCSKRLVSCVTGPASIAGAQVATPRTQVIDQCASWHVKENDVRETLAFLERVARKVRPVL